MFDDDRDFCAALIGFAVTVILACIAAESYSWGYKNGRRDAEAAAIVKAQAQEGRKP